MHILIDECLPKKLKQALSGHTVFTVQEKGWLGTANRTEAFPEIRPEVPSRHRKTALPTESAPR